jgi:hypothetical protein
VKLSLNLLALKRKDEGDSKDTVRVKKESFESESDDVLCFYDRKLQT